MLDSNDYIEEFKDLIESDEANYRVFKGFYKTVADAFDESVINTFRLDQLEEAVIEQENSDVSKLSKPEVRKHVVKTTADIYDELGFLTSGKKKYPTSDEPVKIYQSQSYHGKGHSNSWNDIKQTLGEAMEEAERDHMRTQRQKKEAEKFEKNWRK